MIKYHILFFFVSFCLVGEEDELTVKDAVDTVVEAFRFEGEVIVSFHTHCLKFFFFFFFLQLIEQQSFFCGTEIRYLVN